MAGNKGNSDLDVELAAERKLHQPQQAALSNVALPGFRFHPTEEELVGYYLRRMVEGRRNSVELIASLDLYQYDPWELPAMAFMGEKEWFFFCPRDKKYPNGARPNRVTASGYWKATGTDRAVKCNADFRCSYIGLKKTLVFYTGRAPRGNKTEWIMNEYRLPKDLDGSNKSLISASTNTSVCGNATTISPYESLIVIKNDVALCRIYRKSSSATIITNTLRQTSTGLADCTVDNSCRPESNDHAHQRFVLPRGLKIGEYLQRKTNYAAQKAIASGRGNNCSDEHRTTALDNLVHGLQNSTASSEAAVTVATTAVPPLESPPASEFECVSSSSQSTSDHHHHQKLHSNGQASTTSRNLQSSHALMARLLMEETCSYNGRGLGSCTGTSSTFSVMAPDCGESTQSDSCRSLVIEEGKRKPQNPLAGAIGHGPFLFQTDSRMMNLQFCP